MLHQTLWQNNADIIERCLQHPFVRGLADGTLDRQSFRLYVAQDAYFLRAFFRAYALAAAKCDDLKHQKLFHQLMAGVLEELNLHQAYAQQLDINLDDVCPYAATSAYTNFLLRVAWQESVPEIVAAMVPCMRLYAFLGAELAASLRTENAYADWIKTYSSDEFKAICHQLESMLDDIASDCPAVRDAYGYAMQCELNFFSACLETTS